jgi:hypothetical protein
VPQAQLKKGKAAPIKGRTALKPRADIVFPF